MHKRATEHMLQHTKALYHTDKNIPTRYKALETLRNRKTSIRKGFYGRNSGTLGAFPLEEPELGLAAGTKKLFSSYLNPGPISVYCTQPHRYVKLKIHRTTCIFQKAPGHISIPPANLPIIKQTLFFYSTRQMSYTSSQCHTNYGR